MRITLVLIALALLAAVIVLNMPSAPQPEVETPPSVNARDDTRAREISPPPAAEPEPVPEEAPESVDSDGVREIHIGAGANFMEAMQMLGIENIEERMAQWYKKRGYPFSDATGTYLLDQPYEEYDDATLRAFADNDDIWAQQFLAQRLIKSRPAEALELYQRAAASGSINAMQQIVMLYNRIDLTRADSSNLDEIHRQQLYAMKDAGSAAEMSYAWSVAAELAGGDPTVGHALYSRLEQRLEGDGRERACTMAQSLYEQMAGDRASRGLGDFDRQPPPFMMGSLAEMSSPSCGNLEQSPTVDLSGCEDVRVFIAGQASELVVCNPDRADSE